MTAVARDAAGGEMRFFFHPAFGTLADNIEAVRLAEREGADLALLSYPPQFWPTTEEELLDDTRSFCEAMSLSVMLFALPAWGFERIHPAGMSVDFVRRVLDEIPNVVASKSEQGFPGIAGVAEMYHHFRDEVVISCPIESDALPLMGVVDLQFSGTSNTEWMSGYYPEVFELARTGAGRRRWRAIGRCSRATRASATRRIVGGPHGIAQRDEQEGDPRSHERAAGRDDGPEALDRGYRELDRAFAEQILQTAVVGIGARGRGHAAADVPMNDG
jgi:4-hydroxy-tetrahydrodipicolinate synthase